MILVVTIAAATLSTTKAQYGGGGFGAHSPIHAPGYQGFGSRGFGRPGFRPQGKFGPQGNFAPYGGFGPQRGYGSLGPFRQHREFGPGQGGFGGGTPGGYGR